MPWESNFAPFEGHRSDLDELAQYGRSAEYCLARGERSYRHALMDLRILAETTQRQLSGGQRSDGVLTTIGALRRAGVMVLEQARAIEDLWRLGNQAAHGEKWDFDRSEVISALQKALVICRHQKARILRLPLEASSPFRSPPEDADRDRAHRAQLSRLQKMLTEKHVAQQDAEKLAQDVSALVDDLKARLLQADRELGEQQSIQSAQNQRLAELEVESEEAQQMRADIAERDDRIRELQAEQDRARATQLEVQEQIEQLRKKADLGVDAYQCDYPHGNWMEIPAFIRRMVLPESGDHRCRGPFQSYAYEGPCGKGSFSETHYIGPIGGGATVVLKIPRQPSDPADAEQLKKDWERELSRWQQIADGAFTLEQIVTPIETSPFDYPAWVILERAKGNSLSTWAGRAGCPDPLRGLRVIEALARGVHQLGELGFAYTDLHGGNVIVTENATGALAPRLIDAGDAAPQQRPPEWRTLRHRDLVNSYGAPEASLCRGHSWLLARLTCLTLLGEHGQAKYFVAAEEESLAHLLASPPSTDTARSTEESLRLDLSRRLGAKGTAAVRVDWLANLLCTSLDANPDRRPPNAGKFADRLRKCWK